MKPNHYIFDARQYYGRIVTAEKIPTIVQDAEMWKVDLDGGLLILDKHLFEKLLSEYSEYRSKR